MKFFTIEEFTKACPEYASANITSYQIMAVSEMIFSQVGLIYRDTSWDETNVPLPIKNASYLSFYNCEDKTEDGIIKMIETAK